MIRFIRGKFYPQMDGTVVIETASGIGFLVTIPANSPLYGHFEGEEVKVYTLMTVREDDMSLYGFSSLDELNMFRMLITVNGIGAKAGMAIMSILPMNELKKAIATEDEKMISRANGVGKRTAQRVILELKDKVDYLPTDEEGESKPAPSARNEEKEIAAQALVSLGYSRTEAAQALEKVTDEGLDSEGYIKQALRHIL